MLNRILADFYERDIRKLIEEVNLFTTEENLWKTKGVVKNSGGNPVLHIIGGMNHLIGATSPVRDMFVIATRNLPEKTWLGKFSWPSWKNLFK